MPKKKKKKFLQSSSYLHDNAGETRNKTDHMQKKITSHYFVMHVLHYTPVRILKTHFWVPIQNYSLKKKNIFLIKLVVVSKGG